MGIMGCRRLCKAKKGYFALVPEDLKEGDIFMPTGSQLPFLLRRSGGEYTLKNACYVHGMARDWAFEESGCPEQETIIA